MLGFRNGEIITTQLSQYVIYEEQQDGSLKRKRTKIIGNTVYTVIAGEKPNARATAFDTVKRLIENGANSVLSINDSLEGCHSGGNKE